MRNKAIFILGPTAVGKTFFGVKLAKKIGGEIISSDSVQIYKGLDIGSAKVTKQEMQGIVHHAIDILEPEQNFSVFDFVEYTKNKIQEICQKGKTPIIVGGTGLYVKALTLGYNFGDAGKNDELRKKLEKMAEEKGNSYLFEMLKNLDPKVSENIDKNNLVRLVRALEIAMSSGEKKQSEVDLDFLVIALNRDRKLLYDDINKRVDIMLEHGLIEEVESLRKRGIGLQHQCMKAIGYKEVYKYLEGEYNLEKMKELLKQHSRNYAKRQLTFLRGMQNVCFVDVENREQAFEKISNLVDKWLSK